MLKKSLCHRCFLVSFGKFLRTSFLTEHLWWLLLQNSQENTSAIVLFEKKVAGLRPATLLKKRFWHRYFPVNYAKNTFFTELLRWLLLLRTPCKLSFVIMGVSAALEGEGNGCCRSTQGELSPTFPSCLLFQF